MTTMARSFAAFLVLVPALASAQETTVAAKRTSRPTLGVERVRGVQESGFYNTERGQSGEPFRWTNGSARLIVPFSGPVPVALHVRLGFGVPKPTKLTILANGTHLFDETVQPQTEWARTFDLARVVTKSPITIQILSDTFIPSGAKNQGLDDRDLGVCIRGITVLDTVPDYTGVNLAAEPLVGVNESGFHNRELAGDQPCRWTDGKAKVAVPVPDGRRWNRLAVMAAIPDRPNYRVRLMVNGRVLFDDEARRGKLWIREFPLEGIDLDQQAVIELTSSTMAPGKLTAEETRTLGIRLLELILWGG